MKQLCIVGAGPAGLAAAWALRDAPVTVTIIEKSRGVSGRATTRRRPHGRYDHGAQYFKVPDALHTLIHDTWSQEGLFAIDKPVWTFGADAAPTPSEPSRANTQHWCYTQGINQLGKHILAASEAELHTQTRVSALQHNTDDGKWSVLDDARRVLGRFDAVLITAPSPQAAEIVESSGMEMSLRDRLSHALRRGRYKAVISLMLGYQAGLSKDFPFYALVNEDKVHDVGWLAFEHCKPERVAAGEALILLQMSEAWSVAHFRVETETLIEKAVAYTNELLDLSLAAPDWHDIQRWRFALPDTLVDVTAMTPGMEKGLFFAGDSFVGGRVHRALTHGLEMADTLKDWLR